MDSKLNLHNFNYLISAPACRGFFWYCYQLTNSNDEFYVNKFSSILISCDNACSATASL